MNHIPSYPVIPVTSTKLIPASRINASLTISDTTSTKLYECPANSGGSLFSNVIINMMGNSAACVLRFILNNGEDFNVTKNNVIFAEYAIPAVTASGTVIAHRQQQILEMLLPPKYRIYMNLSVSSSSTISVTGSFLEY
jgi:hypothetical protein